MFPAEQGLEDFSKPSFALGKKGCAQCNFTGKELSGVDCALDFAESSCLHQ